MVRASLKLSIQEHWNVSTNDECPLRFSPVRRNGSDFADALGNQSFSRWIMVVQFLTASSLVNTEKRLRTTKLMLNVRTFAKLQKIFT